MARTCSGTISGSEESRHRLHHPNCIRNPAGSQQPLERFFANGAKRPSFHRLHLCKGVQSAQAGCSQAPRRPRHRPAPMPGYNHVALSQHTLPRQIQGREQCSAHKFAPGWLFQQVSTTRWRYHQPMDQMDSSPPRTAPGGLPARRWAPVGRFAPA